MMAANVNGTKKPKYRVVEYLPGVYRIQTRGLLWGWNWHSGDYGPWDFLTAHEAEKIVMRWKAEEAHQTRVVSEF